MLWSYLVLLSIEKFGVAPDAADVESALHRKSEGSDCRLHPLVQSRKHYQIIESVDKRMRQFKHFGQHLHITHFQLHPFDFRLG